jgi:hypothetical protein
LKQERSYKKKRKNKLSHHDLILQYNFFVDNINGGTRRSGETPELTVALFAVPRSRAPAASFVRLLRKLPQSSGRLTARLQSLTGVVIIQLETN